MNHLITVSSVGSDFCTSKLRVSDSQAEDWSFDLLSHLGFTQKQIDEWGVQHHELLLGKPQYDIFVDDRAINNKEWYKQNNLKVTE